MIAATMWLWELTVIEGAVGDDASAVLPEAIPLVLMRVRVPRYQATCWSLAHGHRMSVDEIVTRELEDART